MTLKWPINNSSHRDCHSARRALVRLAGSPALQGGIILVTVIATQLAEL